MHRASVRAPATIALVNRRFAKLSTSAVAVLVLAGACSSGDGAGDQALLEADPASTAAAAQGETEAGGTDGDLAVEAEEVPPGEGDVFENYAEWSVNELGPLVPSPEALGSGWANFYAELISEEVIFDPATDADQACGLTAPVVATNGLYAEQGFGDSVDDMAIIVSRGDPAASRPSTPGSGPSSSARSRTGASRSRPGPMPPERWRASGSPPPTISVSGRRGC